MDRSQQADKNLELAREFFLGLLDAPPESWPPDGTEMVFLPSDDPKLFAANVEMATRTLLTHPGDRATITRMLDGRLVISAPGGAAASRGESSGGTFITGRTARGQAVTGEPAGGREVPITDEPAGNREVPIGEPLRREDEAADSDERTRSKRAAG